MNNCNRPRCTWVNLNNPVYVDYHDCEWGVPCREDGKLFEMLLLESFQAGLSWECVLNKRENFRAAFDGFDAEKIAHYGDDKKVALMNDVGIIRNQLKIEAVVTNAKIFLKIREEHGSFYDYLCSFTGGEIVRESCDTRTTSPLSDAISADLKRRGMKFVGSTIIYSYLQAVGVIDGHEERCEWGKEEADGGSFSVR